MPKVSVIIPIYGVERYIERCARSLFEQSLDDIEFIFVDDCTKDSSIDILVSVLEDYPHRKHQTQILHHENNQGLPFARKTGIMAANGEYVAHCDSDDWVDTDMYRLMYEKAVYEMADIVICDYYISDSSSIIVKSWNYSEKKDLLIQELLFEKGTWAVWNKLVRRNLYNDKFIYLQDNMGEDMAYSIQVIYSSDRVKYLKKPLYYYFDNPNSITGQKTVESHINKFQQACRNTLIVDDILKNNSFFNDAILNIKAVERNLLLQVISEPGVGKMWRCQFDGLTWKLLKSKRIHSKQKLRALYYELKVSFNQLTKKNISQYKRHSSIP